jgi:hypothetical protein
VSRRPAVIAAGSAVLFVGGVVFSLLSTGEHLDATIGNLFFVVTVAAFSGVGYVLSTRLPGNRIGWLCLAIGAMYAVVAASTGLARWGLSTGALSRPVGEWISVASNVWVVALGLIGTQLPLRLPDGELPSPRWRWFSRLTLVLIVGGLVPIATIPGPVEDVPGTANPLGAEWASALEPLLLLLLACFPVALASLVLRYRRAGPTEQAQLRWIAFSGVVFVAVYGSGLLLGNVLPEDQVVATTAEMLMQLTFAALPIAIGHAVLRRHLYDLGAVVSRTVSYACLTVLLAAVYVGSVLLLQVLLAPVTEGSGIAVAVSTLAVAALFRPARAAIQAGVDRRFYRRRYDARHTVDAFVVRLRDEIDLGTVEDDLTTTVSATLQPASMSVWLPER